MSWKDRLVTASFRGMEFKTESHEAKLGRRLVVHEFPGADLPLIEDLGIKAADLSLNAYFIGADYDLARDKFLLLLQKTGADWLMHPWLGRLEVRAKDWALSESNEKGGFCTIQIQFVPAGLVITQAKIDANDAAAAKLKTLADTTQTAFPLSIMSTNAVTQFILKVSAQLDYFHTILTIASVPMAIAQQVKGMIQGIKNDFTSLLNLPSSYISAVRNVFEPLLSLNDGVLVLGSQAVLVDSADTISGGLQEPERVKIVKLLTGLATQQPINQAVLSSQVSKTSPLELPINLERNKALQALFLISIAGQLALADYQNKDNRDFCLNALKTAIDAVLPVLPDDVFQAAVAARVAVIEALNTQLLDSVREREIYQAMPATVLAYRFEMDERIFNAVNHVRHPLFVQGVIYD